MKYLNFYNILTINLPLKLKVQKIRMNMDKYKISSNLLNDEARRYFKLHINTICYKLALIQNSAI